MNISLYRGLLNELELHLPPNSIRSYLSGAGPGLVLQPKATFFEWVVIDQRRYPAFEHTKSIPNTNIAVKDGSGAYRVGQLMTIFAVRLGLPQMPFVQMGEVRMLKTVEDTYPSDSAWART
jgi:hypothetical protein